ncbi:deoxyribose-phosphate aldolase [Candidatus Microgenomates bacterium]|nr:deoxyribose-phosphate aldolase [Candidatus Microgenomates bacterium]
MNDLAKYLDLANHHANATEEDVRVICEKVKKYGFNSAFVNPAYVVLAKSLGVKVGTVIAFPLGQEILAIKLAAARAALTDGADELDVSLNVGYIKEGKWDKVTKEMKAIVGATREISTGKIVKFIPECGYLTDEEIKRAAELMVEAGADFFKTCSGMGPRGATLDDVRLVRQTVGQKIKIKVAGGIETYDQAREFINAGADRIGTSHAVEIVTGAAAQKSSGE